MFAENGEEHSVNLHLRNRSVSWSSRDASEIFPRQPKITSDRGLIEALGVIEIKSMLETADFPKNKCGENIHPLETQSLENTLRHEER